jgi:hypothetical protein
MEEEMRTLCLCLLAALVADPALGTPVGKSFDVEVYGLNDKKTFRDTLEFPDDKSLRIGILEQTSGARSAPVTIRPSGAFVLIQDISSDRTLNYGNLRFDPRTNTIEGSFAMPDPKGGSQLRYTLTGKANQPRE